MISHQGVMAIPKAATIAHVQQNAAVLVEPFVSRSPVLSTDSGTKGKTALDMV